MNDIKFLSRKCFMFFMERCKCITKVLVTSEVSFTFPVTCLCLVVIWVLHPAAASTKVDSKESFFKSRVPSSSSSCLHPFSHLYTHTHTHTHAYVNHKFETYFCWHVFTQYAYYPYYAHTQLHAYTHTHTWADLFFFIHVNILCCIWLSWYSSHNAPVNQLNCL